MLDDVELQLVYIPPRLGSLGQQPSLAIMKSEKTIPQMYIATLRIKLFQT